MKTTLLILTATTALAHAEPEKVKTVSHLPEKGLGQLIADRLDIASFPNSLHPRRMDGQRHFADLGMKPASITDQLVDFSDEEWTFTIRVLERRDQNRDGIEDISIRLADISKVGTYADGATLLVTRYTADGDLIALAYGPADPEPEAPPAPAADSPEGVVTALYKAHAEGKSPFFQNKERASVDRTFTRAFAALIWKDANQPEGEQGAISADPLIDAQDGEPRKLEIAAEKPKDGKVLVVATFKLLGKARRVRFRMEQEDGVWKIADILGHDFTSLRDTLEPAHGKPAPQAR